MLTAQPEGGSAMSDIRKILVPTDFSDCSAAAATTAATLAAKLGATVSLVTVVDTSGFLSGFGQAIPLREGVAQLLTAAQDRIREFAGKHLAALGQVPFEVREGSTWKEILTAAENSKADLIIIGTHGHTGVAHMLLGSVAEKVVRHSKVPVMTVRTP